MYREVILDHYKNPRGHGVMEGADAEAEGQNPLCGDEVAIYVAFGDDGETIDEVKFSGRGCAISQAATSMLTEMVQGKTATDVARLDKQELQLRAENAALASQVSSAASSQRIEATAQKLGLVPAPATDTSYLDLGRK